MAKVSIEVLLLLLYRQEQCALCKAIRRHNAKSGGRKKITAISRACESCAKICLVFSSILKHVCCCISLHSAQRQHFLYMPTLHSTCDVRKISHGKYGKIYPVKVARTNFILELHQKTCFCQPLR